MLSGTAVQLSLTQQQKEQGPRNLNNFQVFPATINRIDYIKRLIIHLRKVATSYVGL